MADGNMPKKHNQGMKHCFMDLHEYTNSSVWFHIKKDAIEYAIFGLPEMERAHTTDPGSLHAILELAMLVRADECVEYSHMAQTISNLLRQSLGKKPCHHLFAAPPASTARGKLLSLLHLG